MLRRAFQTVSELLTRKFDQFFNGTMYGHLAPAMITVNNRHELLGEQHERESDKGLLSGLLDSIWRFSTPVRRRTAERRLKRRLSFVGHMEHYQRKRNLVACLECGYWHERQTLCANCYSKVQAETARIRAQLPDNFKFDMPAQEASVAYENEATLKEQLARNGRFVINASGTRPSWFSAQLLTKRSYPAIRSGHVQKAAEKPSA